MATLTAGFPLLVLFPIRHARQRYWLRDNNMKHGLIFLALGAALIFEATLLAGFWWLLVWPGISFMLVASAYLGVGPRVFGKRSDGTMAWTAVVVLLPYLLLTWGTWRIMRVLSREDCYNRVTPELFIGRRPLANEIPPEITLVVDLTAEFSECRRIREGRHYLAAPMLDAAVPEEIAFKNLVRRICQSSGPVYIHCAQGHGRTGLVAAAVLLMKGHFTKAEDALAGLQAVRPQLDLRDEQLEFLKRVCDTHDRRPSS